MENHVDECKAWLYALTWFTANTLRAGSGRQPQGNLMYIGLQYLPLNILNQRKAVRTFESEDLCLYSMKSVEETNGSPSVSSSWEPKWRWPKSKSNYTMKVHLQQSTAPFPILKWLKSLTSISSPPWEELCLGFVLETRKQVGRQMATWDRHQTQDQSRLNAGIRKWLNAVKHCKYIAEIATKRRHAGANMAGLACLGSQTGQV